MNSVYLSERVRREKPSATVALNERSNALLAEGKQVFKLGLGQSPFPVPPSVVKALADNAHQKDYLPVTGLPALREAVASYHRDKQGLMVSADDIIIGPGSKELMFLLQVAYDAEVVLPSPAWVSYAPQGRIVGRAVRWIHTLRADGFKLTGPQLAQHCIEGGERARMLILNYPNNPTGLSYTAAELKSLAEVCERHGVLVLADEIYAEMHHRSDHVSMANFFPQGTIVSGGLSKWCGAGGWRLGTFAIPEGLRWLRDAVRTVASESFTSTSAPIQHAAVTAFEGNVEIDDYLLHSRRIVSALGKWCAQTLRAADIDTPSPDGGFYLFPDFAAHIGTLKNREIGDAAELCERLLDDTGVAMLPGSAFGRAGGEWTGRIAYVDFDGGAALEAARTTDGDLDETFLREHCPKVTEACERISSFL